MGTKGTKGEDKGIDKWRRWFGIPTNEGNVLVTVVTVNYYNILLNKNQVNFSTTCTTDYTNSF